MHARTSTQASTLLQLHRDQHRFSPSAHHSSCCVCYLPADAGEVPAQWPFQRKGHYTRLESTHLTYRSYSSCRHSSQSILLSFPSYLVATLWFTRCAPRSLLGSSNCSCPRHAPAHSHRHPPAPVNLHLSLYCDPVQRLHFPPPQPSSCISRPVAASWPLEKADNKPEAEVDPAPAPTRSITCGRYVSSHTKTHRFCALFSFTPSLPSPPSVKQEKGTGPRLQCFGK